MSSLAIKLPLTLDVGDGYKTIKSFKELIKQNFKMLLLTYKGERVMIPNYGIGLKQYLFESMDQSVFSRIENEILEQVAIYMPVVAIQEIVFQQHEDAPNGLTVKITYAIPDIAVQDLLEFTI
jgi:phage baseplate assembly protein W